MGSGTGAVRPHSEGEEVDNEEEYKDKGQVRVDTNRSKEQLACVSYAAIMSNIRSGYIYI